MEFYKYLETATLELADHTAVICDDIQYTYRELYLKVKELGEKLKQLGVKPGKKVALVTSDPIDFIISFLAINYIKAIILPIYVHTGWEKIDYMMQEFCIDFALISSDTSLQFSKSNIYHVDHTFDNCEDLLLCRNLQTNAEDINSDVALILFSSGTTNLPKAIMLTRKNVCSNVEGISAYLKLSENDRILIIKNLNHASSIVGEMLVGLYNGCSLFFTRKLPTVTNILDILAKDKITTFFAVPTILKGIIENKKLNRYDLNSLRIINFYGAPMPQQSILKLTELFYNTNIIYSYGLTEASPRVTYIERKDILARPSSSGKTINDVKIKILDDNGYELESYQQGEITVQGPNVMLGYYKNEILTNKVICNGILHTRDLGYLDEDGFLYVTGRKDNMIISAGKNIYPEEIEGVITIFPGIMEALVKGEKAENETYNIIAYVVLSEGMQLNIKEVYEHCKSRLENYKIPKEVRVVKEFEKTVSGKLKRKQEFKLK